VNPLDWDLGNVPPGIPWGGLDEAGRGAWAGPVVAACVVLDRATVTRWGHVLRAARDSKALRPERRALLASELRMILPAWAVAEVDNLTIDRENILEATFTAMRQAARQVALRPRILFVDGNRAPRTGLPERLVVDGDALSCAVACASILAKSHRDALLCERERTHPGYRMDLHKGYGTPVHRERLEALGPSSWHRLSYAPVAARLRADPAVLGALEGALARCATVEALHAWVELELRPAYGRLDPAWLEELRNAYGRRLAGLAGTP